MRTAQIGPDLRLIPAKSYWRLTETNCHYYGRTAQKNNCIVLNLLFTDKEWHFGSSRICFVRFYHLVTDTCYYIRDSKSRVSAKITGNDISRVKMTPRNQIKLQNNERKLKETPVSDKGTSVLGQCVQQGYWQETIGSLGNDDGDVD